MSQTPNADKVRNFWGDDIPSWVTALAHACDADSQSGVARRLGVSPGLISNVLGAKYPGDMERIEALCRGEFEKSTVTCPVLGEIAPRACDRWQGKSDRLGIANNMNARMYRACRACPKAKRNRKITGGGS